MMGYMQVKSMTRKLNRLNYISINLLFLIEDGITIWYHRLDFDPKHPDDELDQIKIQALDGNEEVLWEESFENEYVIRV